MKDHGYIALYRTVFGHHLFKDEKPVTRLHAWTWLVAKAAWCPKQERVGRAIATLDRGQLATTLRDLGTTWGWSVGKVRRFLETLRRDAMIRTLVAGTQTGTQTGTLAAAQHTIITICNYSKFQGAATAADVETARKPARKPTRHSQQVLDLDEEILPQPLNHPTKETRGGDKVGEKRAAASPPREGARSKKHGTVYCRKGSSEWEAYAKDFKDVTGAEPLPDRHGGYWFCWMGEAARPAQQRGWQRRARRA